MNRNLENYILHKNNFIDDNICDQAVKEMDTIQFHEHNFYDPITKEYKPRSGAQELSMSFDNTPSRKIITKKLWYAIRDYLQFINMPWFSRWAGYTDIRFNKYAEDKRMALHCDHIRSMFDGERKGVPILSVLGVLNDDYEGGDFVMFDNMKIEFKKGDVILFPSNFLYPHRVEPIKKGTRYSYISWVW